MCEHATVRVLPGGQTVAMNLGLSRHLPGNESLQLGGRNLGRLLVRGEFKPQAILIDRDAQPRRSFRRSDRTRGVSADLSVFP